MRRDVRYKQRGMSLSALLLWSVVLIFVAILGMKMIPVYREYAAIKTTLAAMTNDPVLLDGTKEDIRKSFNKRAQIDDISAVNGNDLDINKESGKIVLGIIYSVKTPLFANISLYFDFNVSSEK
ncbi:MAG: DUF4845 domain-containing protein [Nitrosomonadales bacterium]|jgi:hypothetical protein|nr:MAG: DUF4845 domain-containing protein [Nitrosomonadales bacterium]